MNRDHDYGGIADNQLRTFAHIGLFKKPLPKQPAAYQAYPDPFDRAADLNARARTYLQVNCSICHVADGGGNSLIDLAYKTTLAKTHMLNEPPIHETYGIAAASPDRARRSATLGPLSPHERSRRRPDASHQHQPH